MELQLSAYKSLKVSFFRGEVYIHIQDVRKQKRISFSRKEFGQIVRHLKKIKEMCDEVQVKGNSDQKHESSDSEDYSKSKKRRRQNPDWDESF